ncbi:hypothetical protein AMK59_399 [Oryctes borbonicus]|uniref:Arginyl-tRNA--protein transferase 1 n=1 Tax=Oryctes borbonicus TaxID=1629725 RepID=A0A0T6BDC8_9SCAR|nr:hypothetical protein AMK59_399 [Oryctes borbonicus]
MWVESMTVHDYQTLIDRGWRRSGRYCYKPIMNEICCPQYTIRCNVLNFKISKSHKKIIKKMNRFMNDGILHKSPVPNENEHYHEDIPIIIKERPDVDFDYASLGNSLNEVSKSLDVSQAPSCSNAIDIDLDKGKLKTNKRDVDKITEAINEAETADITDSISTSPVKKGLGADPNKPPCKKAKLLRLEKKQQKLREKGLNLMKTTAINQEKSLEQFLYDLPENCRDKLQIKLVNLNNGEDASYHSDIEFEIYNKYQTIIHNDPPEKCSKPAFLRFLVDTPLKPEKWTNNDNIGFGSFHQQYWLDEKLIAVGVIDILPKCVSSVYFFYDPDYRSLTLGTYGSLSEIGFTRRLYQSVPSITYYYMGFYIHSCPKMRYKGRLVPSDLLCPETYKWFPITDCIPKLEQSKYCRFETDPKAEDEDACSASDIDQIKIWVSTGYVKFHSYSLRNRERKTYQNIGKQIGKKCVGTFVFIRPRH